MLVELHVRDLGVIADLTLTFDQGMTALTGETGAGKTLVVEAIELLVGGKADALLVRPGAEEARVEGRFVQPGGAEDELVLARVIPAAGRSRAYVNGRLATASELADLGARLVDLHGQHAHQGLLSSRVQRDSLDRHGRVDLGPLRAARTRLAAIDADLSTLGGDERARAREIDLLRYQVREIDEAAISGPAEEDELEQEDDLLSNAAAYRDAGHEAYRALVGDGGAADGVGSAMAALAGHRRFEELAARARALAAEVVELGGDLRHAAEAVESDPERLDAVRSRRRLLADLRRKYGERLSDVLEFAAQARARLAELEQHGERARALEAQRSEVAADVAGQAATVAAARRRAAPLLAAEVERHLHQLAMGGARFEIAVKGDNPGDDVTFLLGANPGEASLPLAKVASGGELARTMLALRLALGPGPLEAHTGTLIFDEVDAGIGGQAAAAVGRALASVPAPQVVVVTHLPQVAAFADHQVAVSKLERDGRTVAEARRLSGEERVVELSRMLSGQPASATARGHAEELLATAARERPRSGAGAS